MDISKEPEWIQRLIKQEERRQERMDYLYNKCPLKYVKPWFIWNEFSQTNLHYNKSSWNNK